MDEHEIRKFDIERSKAFSGMPKKVTTLVKAESDRGAILILAAYLDEILGHLIQSACAKPKLGEKMLEFQGPAGSFSNRILLCEAFALIHHQEASGLTAVRKIRNAAAHFESGRGFDVLFDSAKTLSYVKNLAKSQNIDSVKIDEKNAREIFIVCVRLLATKLYFQLTNTKRAFPAFSMKEIANMWREELKGTERGEFLQGVEDQIKKGDFESFDMLLSAFSEAIKKKTNVAENDGPIKSGQ